MCDEYRLNAELQLALGLSAHPWLAEGALLPGGEIAVRQGDLAPLLVPKDPAAPEAGLRLLIARWWLVPSFHHGAVSEWRVVSALARLEALETRHAYLEAYRWRRALAPFTSFIVYAAGPGGGRRSSAQGWTVKWWPTGPTDTVRFFPAIWETATPPGERGEFVSFAIVVGQPAKTFVVPEGSGPLARRQPRLLDQEQGMEWLRLDGPGKRALLDPRPQGGFMIEPWSPGSPADLST
jgi:putative SOS response-associated peptidase YedK